jgi:hypothetical protein
MRWNRGLMPQIASFATVTHSSPIPRIPLYSNAYPDCKRAGMESAERLMETKSETQKRNPYEAQQQKNQTNPERKGDGYRVRPMGNR